MIPTWNTGKENYFRFIGAMSEVGRGSLAGCEKVNMLEIGDKIWLLSIMPLFLIIIAHEVL